MARINEHERQMMQFGATLAREAAPDLAGSVGRVGATLCALGRRIDSLAVRLCNGTIEQDAYDRQSDKAEVAALMALRELGEGFGVVAGGDPRGCCLKVTVPSGYTDDMGREGVCVPYAR